jgi:hypothetical protein
MNGGSISRALLSGIIGVAIGLVITYVVSLIIPTENLTWSLIAVGFASFFAAFAGHLSGASQR